MAAAGQSGKDTHPGTTVTLLGQLTSRHCSQGADSPGAWARHSVHRQGHPAAL